MTIIYNLADFHVITTEKKRRIQNLNQKVKSKQAFQSQKNQTKTHLISTISSNFPHLSKLTILVDGLDILKKS